MKQVVFLYFKFRSENFVFYLIPKSSTSKIKVLLGPISFEICSFPYAKCGGITSFHLLPVDISCKASVHPSITLFKGNVAGFFSFYRTVEKPDR